MTPHGYAESSPVSFLKPTIGTPLDWSSVTLPASAVPIANPHVIYSTFATQHPHPRTASYKNHPSSLSIISMMLQNKNTTGFIAALLLGFALVANAATQCQLKRSLTINSSRGFVYECTANGEYAHVQCGQISYTGPYLCWCSTRDGVKQTPVIQDVTTLDCSQYPY
ncbi:hypothetical protein EMPS_07270 [Entomortierella parvispora]|uniref:Thyroglobulin type-1 domain-containing protein n=1 Tax=Entomortierella parvispora TaxID=205924 RepID=A0A9P3HEL6_9FUNG|nr:hypothetical protein EMPS_07270 [Entomortierella parvispora]